MSDHYLPQIHLKSWPKSKLGYGRVWTLLRITFPVHRKSYLVIICPNSHAKLTSWSWYEHCSESLVWPLGSHICSLFSSIHMKSWPKIKLGQPIESHICSLFAPFTWKVDQLKSVRTLLRITRLAPSKSYLLISFLNSHEKLTKN